MKIKLLLITLSLLPFFLGFITPIASADCANPTSTKEAVQCGTNGASNMQNPDPAQATSNLESTIRTGLNIASSLVGVAAVIMLIIGGFRYITSAGKQESVTSAKNTIVYALIGLVIVAVAQFLVHFVIQSTTVK